MSPPSLSRRVLVALLSAPLFLAPGCGEDRPKVPAPAADPPPAAPTPARAHPEPPLPPQPSTPAEIGAAAGGIYVRTLTTVVDLMAGTLPAQDLGPRLVGVREAAIGELVLLGRTRATFDAAGKARTDAAIAQGLSSVPAKVFEDFLAGQKRFQAEDRELGNLIASFNILTQYANFELLKEQAPDEASRLGID